MTNLATCSAGSARTNNNVEGWNRRFSLLLGTDHPSIWKLIDNLKQEQYHTEFRLNQGNAGAQHTVRRLKYREPEAKLSNIVSKFGTTPLDEYLE